MKIGNVVCFTVIGLLLFSMNGAVLAGSGSRFSLAAGAWFQEIEGSVQVTEGVLTGNVVNLENTLGLEEDTAPSLAFSYRPGGRYKLTGGYASIENTGRKRITTTINYKGVQYLVNSTLTSSVETGLLDLNYHRILSKTEKNKLSLMLGLRYLDVEASITGTTLGGTQTRTESFEIPVPVIGFSGKTKMSEKVSLSGSFGYMEIDSGNDRGEVSDLDFRLNYHIRDDLKIIVGYRSLDLEAESGDDSAEIKYSGMKLFLSKKF